jgi:hypothetical protein
MKSKSCLARTWAWSVAIAPLALATTASGCSSSSSPPNSAADAAASPDSSTTCANHLPSGFTNVTAVPASDTHTGYYGLQPTMALDENDDPMFAYFVGGDGGVYTLYFTQWDPCAGAFTTPLLIDTLSYGISTGSAERNVSIAYDPSTKEIGIAYNPTSSGQGAGDGNSYVMLASRKSGAATFTTQVASRGLSSVVGTSHPVIAMGGGQVYIAYEQGNYNCGQGPSCQGLQLLTSTTTPPAEDAGAEDAGSPEDAGPPPAHYFNEQALQFNGTFAQARPDSISIAIDSGGNVGVAFFQVPANYDTTLLFWRNGMASAVAVTDTNNIQNDGVEVSLQFEGTKPRIAAAMVATASPTSHILFEASADGTTWNAPVAVPEDNGSNNGGFTIAFAMDGAGNGVITTDVNGGPALCADPYLAQTTDDGTAWSSCVSDYAKGTNFTVETMSAAYGQSRNKGKFVLSFQNSLTDPVASSPNGVWLYQSP